MVPRRATRATSRQVRVMSPLRRLGQTAFTALLCVSLLAWSVLPASTHTFSTFETLQGHVERIETHGHSHGLEE